MDWSPVKTAGSRRNLNGTPFPTKVVQSPAMRGCPACLREDAAGSDLPSHLAMAMRGHWLVPHVFLCLEHEHPLVPLWRDPSPTSRFDSVRHLAEIDDDLISGRFDKTLRDPTDFDLWLDDRLQGIASGGWLDRQPLHAAANFCLMLGYALLRHEEIAPSAIDPDDRWGLQQMGFEIARGGEDAVRAALRGLQALPGGPHEGPKKVFPVLYDRLSHHYHDNPDYAAFRAILRAHMLETWPLGIGDEVMGEPVMERRLHSVRTAAAATGIDPRRFRKMLSAAGLVPDGGDALPDAWQVFEAEAAEPLLRDLQHLVTTSAFAQLIGASRSQFDLLVADGVLQPALNAPDLKAVWSPADGTAFL
ncbi:TniQ family protein [Halovulum sp. GXIMD14794]